MEETMKITSRLWRFILMPISLAGMLSISSGSRAQSGRGDLQTAEPDLRFPLMQGARKALWLLAIPTSRAFT